MQLEGVRSVALDGPCPYHGAFTGGKMSAEPQQDTEPLASIPQQHLSCSQILPTSLSVSCGHETVALSPSWEAALHWLQLYYMAVGTAEAERASSLPTSCCFGGCFVKSLPRAWQLMFPMEELCLLPASGWLCSQRAVLKDKSKGEHPWSIPAMQGAPTSPRPICCSPPQR